MTLAAQNFTTSLALWKCSFTSQSASLMARRLFLFLSHVFLMFLLCQPWHESSPKVSWQRTHIVGAKVNTFLTTISLSDCGSRWAVALMQEQRGRRRQPYCQGSGISQVTIWNCSLWRKYCSVPTAVSGEALLSSAEGPCSAVHCRVQDVAGTPRPDSCQELAVEK